MRMGRLSRITSNLQRQQSCHQQDAITAPLSHSERLAVIVAGGQAKQYGLVVAGGKALTADQVDAMEEEEVEKLYARYEVQLGAAMTKTLGQAVL